MYVSGDGCEGMCAPYRADAVVILPLSMTVVWEPLKGDSARWRAKPAGPLGCTEGNVSGPQPAGGRGGVIPGVEGTIA